MKTELASEHIHQFFEQMHHLGFSDEETLEMIQDVLRREQHGTDS